MKIEATNPDLVNLEPEDHKRPTELYTGTYVLALVASKNKTEVAALPGVKTTTLQTSSQMKMKAEPFLLAHNSPQAGVVAAYLNGLKMAQRDTLLLVLKAGPLPFTETSDLSNNTADFMAKHFGGWVAALPAQNAARLKAVLAPKGAPVSLPGF